MRLLIPLLTLAGFIWLAQYSREQGYTLAQVEALNRLVASTALKPPTRSSGSLLRQQAAAYKALYGVTDDEIAKPVELWK